VSVEPLQQSVSFTQSYTVQQSNQQAVVISVRQYERLIERLDGCKQGGWGDLWLAGVGAGVALAAAAGVTATTLPKELATTRNVLWAATVAGIALAAVCLVAYFTQRRDHAKEIAELKKDLEMHKPEGA
jgi:hypothetical protein